MTRKKTPKTGKTSRTISRSVKRTPEDTFAFWDAATMREAKPISIDVDPPGEEPDDPKEK